MSEPAEEVVEITDHAWTRWQSRRAADPGHGPVLAWDRAERVPEPHGLDADEVRYHAPTDLAMVAGVEPAPDGTRVVVTMIRGEGAKPALREAIEVVRDE